MWGRIATLEDTVREYGGEDKLPPYPGVAELPAPYQDHVIVIDVRCMASLINDPRGSGKQPNMYWKLPDMQVPMLDNAHALTRGHCAAFARPVHLWARALDASGIRGTTHKGRSR